MAPARSSLARCVSLGLPRHPFQAVIESLGLDPAATCADRLILRLQPSGDTHRGRRVTVPPPAPRHVGLQRHGPDQPLGSGVPARAGRHHGDLADAVRPAGAQHQRRLGFRETSRSAGALPVAARVSGPLDGVPEVPVLIEPGDLLCFSGTHLHASRPNRTGRTRLSIDTRIVEGGDLRAGKGPANVDGHAPRTVHEWFRNVASGEPLAPP